MSVTTTLRKYQNNFKEHLSQLEKDRVDLENNLQYDDMTYQLFLDRGIKNKQITRYERILDEIKELDFKIKYLNKIEDCQIVMSDGDLKKIKKEFKFKMKEISTCYEDLPDILTVLNNVNYSLKPLFFVDFRSKLKQNLSSINHKGLNRIDYDDFIKIMKSDTYGYAYNDFKRLNEKLIELNNKKCPYISVSKKIDGYFSFGNVEEIYYLTNKDQVLYFQRIQYGYNLLIFSNKDVPETEVSFFDNVYDHNKFIEDTENHLENYNKIWKK